MKNASRTGIGVDVGMGGAGIGVAGVAEKAAGGDGCGRRRLRAETAAGGDGCGRVADNGARIGGWRFILLPGKLGF